MRSRIDGFSVVFYLFGVFFRKGINLIMKWFKLVSNRDGGGIKGFGNMYIV